MGVLGRLRGLFAKAPTGAPTENVEPRVARPPRKRDYHRKVELKLRLEPHVKKGAKAWAKEHDTTVSELCSMFLSGLMWSKKAEKLRQLISEKAREV
jgi:hypothetical protein